MKKKTLSILIVSTIAALVLAAIACKNPVLDKVKAIAASANPALSLAIGGTTVAAGGSYNLGSTALATTKNATFTISNSGKDSLTASVTASGNFSVGSQPSGSIAAGASSSFLISFTPTSPESLKSGTVTVASNDPNNKSFSFTVTGVGSTILLPKTGQTAVKLSGDDGSLGIGVAIPSPRFSTPVNNKITDYLTGLMWTQAANLDGQVPWATALAYIQSQNTAGYLSCNDWRLPNREELRSMLDYSSSNPSSSLQSSQFTNVQVDIYWTSTRDSGKTQAWVLDFTDGTLSLDIIGNSHYLWLVRSTTNDSAIKLPYSGAPSSSTSGEDGSSSNSKGAAWPSQRFVARGDGTVTDLLTGLRWQAAPSATTMDWASAISAAAALPHNGTSSWRLPNENELASILTAAPTTTVAAWLNSNGFSGAQSAYYWTSTAYAQATSPSPNSRWCAGMQYGDLSPYDRGTAHYAIFVRSE